MKTHQDNNVVDIAVLKEQVVSLKNNQSGHHEKLNDIHKQLNLIRNDIQKGNIQFKQLFESHEKMERVVENNTSAFNEFKEVLLKMVVEKETTKSNIQIFGKSILWVGAFSSMIYAGYNVLTEWMKK